MEIIKNNIYQELIPAEGKMIKDTVDNDISRKITLPLKVTEEYIQARFIQIDATDFILKDGRKIYTKLAIRRACRELGIEYKLNGILNSNGLFAADWADAQDIDLQDAILLEALKSGDFTDQDISGIIAIIEKG